MDFTEKVPLKSPQLSANPVSKFLFLWIIPLFSKGNRETLHLDDLYDALPEDHAANLGLALERKWKEECNSCKGSDRKPSLIRAIRHVFGRRFMFLGLIVALDELVFKIGTPLVLRKVIHSFSDDAKLEEADYETKKYAYVAGLIVISLLHSLTFQKVIVAIMHLAMKCRVATSSLIYRKVLRLSKSVQSEDANIGKLTNMLGSDASRFDNMFFTFHILYIAPFQLSILTYLLWTELGISCMAGVGVIIALLIPFQVIVGRLSIKFRLEIAKRTDERGRILNEIISGIRVIKMYCYEIPFSMVINKLRKIEVVTIRKATYLRCAFLSMTSLSKVTIPFFSFIVYVSLGNELTAEKVYFSISIYTIMMQGLVQRLPLGVAQFGEFLVAMRRIQAFLLLEEQGKIGRDTFPAALRGSSSCDFFNKEKLSSSIKMNSLTAKWTEQKITLDNIDIELSGNKLVMVVGPVGAGKSSLLNVLISELPVQSGDCFVKGDISYASQDAWVFSGNIRQNILFGQAFDDYRYNKIVEVCALQDDLEQFPNGDYTVVGERGVSLSGGQKARISLARALYKKANIYLLDDPLSAVDARVSRHLFEKCIQEYLGDTLRILVTHQLSYLNLADHIIILNEHGQVSAQGKYDALMAAGIDFISLKSTSQDDENGLEANSIELNVKSSSLNLPLTYGVNKGLENKKSDIISEKFLTGSVKIRTYWEYFKAGDSKIELFFMFLGFLLAQAIASFTDMWLSGWTNEISRRSISSGTNSTSSEGFNEGYSDHVYVTVYTASVIGVAVIITSRSILFFHYCMSISVNLHNRMFATLVRAPVKFFDDTSSGRIMNRFTKDMNSIDEQLPMAFYDCSNVFLFMIGSIVVVVLTNYYVAIPSFFLIIGLWRIRRFYVTTARNLKRLESIAKSPAFLHLSASIQGLTTLRALGAQNTLIDQFDSIQDIHSAACYLIFVSNRWFGLWLDMICLLFLSSVALSFLLLSKSAEVGNVGLAITLTLNIMGTAQWGIRQSSETENYMTSVERAFEYCNVKSEAALESDEDKKPPKDWPASGSITFRDVKLSYDESNANEVLKGLSFEIKQEEKVGIVGRTGAGKSSILFALFRLTEPRGDIVIDGVSVARIGLHDLRKKMSIIPQDPILFSGTMRYNLDPFDQFKDDELWQVLKEVNLGDAIPSLDFKVSDGGGNFSVGQRQLVCLGRAILRKNKIIVMDEATANVDPITDSLIQHTIRQKFGNCTIITIAHRLNTVIDNDRILVLDNGELKEFDTPRNLLLNPIGLFSSMVSQLGPSGEAHLRKLISDSYQ